MLHQDELSILLLHGVRMDRLHTPQPLDLTGNVAEHWKRFKQAFEIYKIASGLDDKGKDVQSMTLLHVIGPEAIEIYNTFEWSDNECQQCDKQKNIHTVDCLLRKFEQYCIPKKNVTIERHVFFLRSQSEGEAFDSFLNDVKLKARTCEFDKLKDSLIKDRIVGGIRNEAARARLLREPDLNLSKAENICRAAETTEKQLKLMSEECGIQAVASKTDLSNRVDRLCNYCGKHHLPRKCPAYI